MHPRIFATATLLGVAAVQALSATTADLAIVRHPAPFKGNLVGSVQILSGETISVEGTANISGNLFVLGTPVITLKSDIQYGGTIVGSGSNSPTTYALTLNTGSTLGHIVTRTDAVALPTVLAPSAPFGTRSVTIKTAIDSPGSFSTLKNLTLERGVGRFVVPGGAYGIFTAKTGTAFVLGVAGSATPTSYDFQSLVLESGSTLSLLGPVKITLATGITVNGNIGDSGEPRWLALNIFSGNLTLNSGYSIYGVVSAPNAGSLVTLKSNSQLVGGLVCDKLSIESGGTLRPIPAPPNQPPRVSLNSPVDTSTFPASTDVTLRATAADDDGTIARVEFYSDATLLGSVTSTPYQYTWTNVPAGSYQLLAKAIDDAGATAASNPVSISVVAPPAITSDATAKGQVGGAFTYQVIASNNPTTYGAEGLPDGLSIDSSTGLITGIPVQPGRVTVTVTAANAGGSASTTVCLTILATVPYTSDFEDAEGYSLGVLDGQLGWTAPHGAASVTDADHANGAGSAELEPSNPPASLTQAFADAGGETVEYVDFFAKPCAQADQSAGSLFMVEGATFGFQLNGAQATLQILKGNTSEAGEWSATRFTTPLDQNNGVEWVRLTARIDFIHRSWDLYANGTMVAANIPASAVSSFLSTFTVQGSASGSTRVDAIYIGPANPLFADINNNGLDDAWESSHGLLLTDDNRNLSPSGSGLMVVQAYVSGTDPNDFYNGTAPQLSILGGNGQVAAPGEFNANSFDVSIRSASGGSLLANAPVLFTVASGGGALATETAGAPSLFSALSLRTGNDGTAHLYYKQPPIPDVASQITARAGSAQVVFDTASSAPLDSDGNGLPDEWEVRFFGGKGVDPSADPDGDGLTNLQELQGGSDPTDFFNGEIPVLTTISGQSQPRASGYLSEAVVVQVYHRDGVTPWPGASVSFSVVEGDGRWAPAVGEATSIRLTVHADLNGQATAFYWLP